MRIRRIASIAAATLAMLAIPGGLTAQGAEPQLFGYSMGATASAISFLYNQPSFGVPTDPTFELRKMYSLAELDSGPTGHGLGSVVWPGQVVGNAPPSLLFDTVIFNPSPALTQLDDPLQQVKSGCAGSGDADQNPLLAACGQVFGGRSGYPIRSESFYPQGPPSDGDDFGPGVRSAAVAQVDQSDGSSTSGGLGIPGVMTFGTLLSHSNSRVVKDQAIAESDARITDIDLFGAVHIDSLVATGRSVSDGQKATNSGTLSISGMTISDGSGNPQAEISLDKSGFHIRSFDKDGKPQDRFTQDPLGDLTKNVISKYLEPQGFNLYIGHPVDLVEGATASRSLAGLIFHIDARGMKKLLDSIPGDLGKQIRDTLKNPTSNTVINPIFDKGLLSPTVAGYMASFFQGDQTMDFVFGSLAVQSAASPPFEDILFPPTIPEIPTTPLAPSTPLTGGEVPPTTTTPPLGSQTLASAPVAVLGVPFGLIAAVIAVGLVGATRLRLFADRVVAAPAAVRCPIEEDER